MVKRGLNQLCGAVETVEGLGTTPVHVLLLKRSLPSLRQVLSIYFQVAMRKKLMIPDMRWLCQEISDRSMVEQYSQLPLVRY